MHLLDKLLSPPPDPNAGAEGDSDYQQLCAASPNPLIRRQYVLAYYRAGRAAAFLGAPFSRLVTTLRACQRAYANGFNGDPAPFYTFTPAELED